MSATTAGRGVTAATAARGRGCRWWAGLSGGREHGGQHSSGKESARQRGLALRLKSLLLEGSAAVVLSPDVMRATRCGATHLRCCNKGGIPGSRVVCDLNVHVHRAEACWGPCTAAWAPQRPRPAPGGPACCACFLLFPSLTGVAGAGRPARTHRASARTWCSRGGCGARGQRGWGESGAPPTTGVRRQLPGGAAQLLGRVSPSRLFANPAPTDCPPSRRHARPQGRRLQAAPGRGPTPAAAPRGRTQWQQRAAWWPGACGRRGELTGPAMAGPTNSYRRHAVHSAAAPGPAEILLACRPGTPKIESYCLTAGPQGAKIFMDGWWGEGSLRGSVVGSAPLAAAGCVCGCRRRAAGRLWVRSQESKV